jgi:hypothetical protein
MGSSSRLAMAWMMRMFAWCGTSHWIADFSSPLAARASSTAEPSLVTATLKTSLPAILMEMSTRARTGS